MDRGLPEDDRNLLSFPELVSWAWRETPPVHRSTANLLIHVVAVPLFVLGHLLVVAGMVFNPSLLLSALACILASLVLQRLGHSLEETPVHPFLGPRDFVRRLYAEQFYNYWRFLFSGGWYASLKASRGRSGASSGPSGPGHP